MPQIFAMIGVLITSVLTLLLISFMLSWPVFMLWNGCLVGAIAGVNSVTWLQAWGLAILSGMLFKSTISKK